MKLTIPAYLIIALFASCAQEKNNNVNDVILRADPSLLSQEAYTLNGFSFQIPKEWIILSAQDSSSRIFMDPTDSSMMLVNTPRPNLSSFDTPQNSSFYHNDISFSQNVYQNELMVLFEVNLKSASDSTDVFYAVPRQSVAEKVSFIEASMGSIMPQNLNN